ncbi:hypothetical protein CIPAW_12G003300 [Carya illinoinensis]|uniref:Uncharacterized protein n=1 Tax=Carya illinoinensis TaxID=32201 RepID=A0A8T1NRX0_CARIL|nr:hypothetical protein CIPAW_12G003300 [Carya illinoinensis]
MPLMYKLRILSLKSTEKFSSLVSSILIRRSTSSRVLHHRRPLPLSSASLCIDFFPVRWEKFRKQVNEPFRVSLSQEPRTKYFVAKIKTHHLVVVFSLPPLPFGHSV